MSIYNGISPVALRGGNTSTSTGSSTLLSSDLDAQRISTAAQGSASSRREPHPPRRRMWSRSKSKYMGAVVVKGNFNAPVSGRTRQ
jgi:hypothetical protein